METKSNLLSIMQRFENASENKGFNLSELNSELEELSSFFNITTLQAYLFGVIFNLCLNAGKNSIKEIAQHIGVKPVALLEHYNDLKVLTRNGLLNVSGDKDELITDYSFSVSNETTVSIISRSIVSNNKNKVQDSISFFVEFDKLIEDIDISHKDYQITLDQEVNKFLETNHELQVVRQIKSYKLSIFEMLYLISICREFLEGQSKTDLNRIINQAIKLVKERFNLRISLLQNESQLIKHKLIVLEDDEYGGKDVVLTKKAVIEFFGQDAMKLLNDNDKLQKLLINPNDIETKNLYYNKSEQSEIKIIEKALYETNYRKLMHNLKSASMPQSITVLLHGSPGVGKTETVYQVAQKTGREIYSIDISKTKSMWFGGSEKLIKEVFDNYKILTKKSDKAPILLFNEADGILSKRKSIGSSNTAQTENTIQNIILQELENLKGIFIATTNLTDNLDHAFERRFLFKVKLSKPDRKVCQRIWLDNIDDLNPSEALILSNNFDFSGGQIANVKRKLLMSKILHRKKLSFKEICNICEQECICRSREFRKIGF